MLQFRDSLGVIFNSQTSIFDRVATYDPKGKMQARLNVIELDILRLLNRKRMSEEELSRTLGIGPAKVNTIMLNLQRHRPSLVSHMQVSFKWGITRAGTAQVPYRS